MAGLGQQIVSADQQVVGFGQQVTSLGQQMIGLSQQMNGFDQKMTGLDQKMTRAKTEANALKRQLNAFSVLEQTTGQLDERLYGLEQDIMAINGFRSDTNATIEQFRAQITELQYQ